MSGEEESFKVLYLDDSELALSTVRQTLAQEGQRVVIAQNLADALAKTDGVDLVIIDYHMPLVNGATALTALRRKFQREATPLFFLYTTDTEVALGFKQLGFDGAFTAKGDQETLRTQFQAARRLLKLKRFRRDRSS